MDFRYSSYNVREKAVRQWREAQGFGHIVCSDSELKRFYQILQEFDAHKGKFIHRLSTSEYSEVLEIQIEKIG